MNDALNPVRPDNAVVDLVLDSLLNRGVECLCHPFAVIRMDRAEECLVAHLDAAGGEPEDAEHFFGPKEFRLQAG